MFSPPPTPSRTPSLGDEYAKVGMPLAATLAPIGMKTLLETRPIQKSGFFACAARNACSSALAEVALPGMRSYLTSQPCFWRSAIASCAAFSGYGTASDDSPGIWNDEMTYIVFFAEFCA